MPDSRSRAEAIEWADRARSCRQRVRDDLLAERQTLDDVMISAEENELVARVKLLWVLESLPGAGKVATRRKLATLGVDPAASLASVDDETKKVLLSEFAPTGRS